MNILITGSTGLVGTALSAYLRQQGQTVLGLQRSKTLAGPYWNPVTGEIEAEKLEGLDAVVHLAGDNVAGGIWTAAKKERILQSRVQGTALLCQTLSTLQHPPKVLISASAVGYYGSQASERILTEADGPGSDFLAQVCVKWEEAARPLAEPIRLCWIRIGIVLSPLGGVLEKMSLPFRLGLGGPLGNGKQAISWIALPDVLEAIWFLIQRTDLSGPFNLTAPYPVTNARLTQELGRALHRPTLIPAPATAIRLVLGEMGSTLLLGGQHVLPERLQANGFEFRYPELAQALPDLLLLS